MEKLITQTLGIKVGETYTAYRNVSRQVESIDMKLDTVIFIEDPSGERARGFCSVSNFLHWKESRMY